MHYPMLIIVATQALFTSSDFLGRTYMHKYGFCSAAFLSWWFALYFFIRTVAMFGQLYIFSVTPLGKTMALFGAVSIVLSNGLGFLFLKEVLPPLAYVGISLAVIAFIIMSVK
jgi:drug/metabolite transporter (DMT)-like permease